MFFIFCYDSVGHFDSGLLCSAETIAPLFIVSLYSSEGSVAARPSIGFCNEFLLGSKHAGCLCSGFLQNS